MTSHVLQDRLLPPSLLAHLQRRFPSLPPETLSLRIEEFLKFLTLAPRMQAGALPVSQEIDDLWHECLLETRHYQALADRIGCFVHHSAIPSDAENLPPRETALMFAAAYRASFGPFTLEALPFWPAMRDLMDYLGLNLPGFNCYLTGLLPSQ